MNTLAVSLMWLIALLEYIRDELGEGREHMPPVMPHSLGSAPT